MYGTIFFLIFFFLYGTIHPYHLCMVQSIRTIYVWYNFFFTCGCFSKLCFSMLCFSMLPTTFAWLRTLFCSALCYRRLQVPENHEGFRVPGAHWRLATSILGTYLEPVRQTFLFFFLFFCLSTFLCLYLRFYLSSYLSIYLCFYLRFYLSKKKMVDFLHIHPFLGQTPGSTAQTREKYNFFRNEIYFSMCFAPVYMVPVALPSYASIYPGF